MTFEILRGDRYDWYDGLSSCPRMVAHSANSVQYVGISRHPGYPEPKMLWPIDPEHPLCATWRGLDDEVIGILRETLPSAWSVVRLRIGHSPKEAHTALFIAVEQETATAEEGQEAVRQIVALLESRHLDVDVEILESSYIQLGRLYDIDALLEKTCFLIDARQNKLKLNLSTAPGAPIAPLNDSIFSGTAGIWLVCGLPEARERFLLTRSHVLSPRTGKAATPETTSLLLSDPVPIAQFSGEAFDECLKWCQGFIELSLEMHDRRQETDRERPDYDASRAEDRRRTIIEDGLFLDRVVEDFSEPNQHIIGLGYAVSNDHSVAFADATWSSDWALIRPDHDAFEGSSVNSVPLTPCFPGILFAKGEDFGWRQKGDFGPERQPLMSSFPLTGDQFDVPRARAESRSLVKLGASSGHQGCVNNVCEARVRLGPDPSQPWTSQLVVFSLDPERQAREFSEPGDSGAAVVDRAGNVMGMVTAGQGFRRPSDWAQRIDLTFVTPIGAILEDLQRAGFENPTIAPGGLY